MATHAASLRDLSPSKLRATPPVQCLSFFAAAVGAPAVAYVVQKLIWPYIPPSPQLLFYPAVFVAARARGAVAGYVATALSVLGMAYDFLPPKHSFAVQNANDMIDLVLF